MRITLLWIIFTALALFATCNSSVAPPRPGCCGDLNSPGTTSVAFSHQIATSADEVPVELQRCGFNNEEITAIRINGTLAGCVNGSSADVIFTRLNVFFTTNGARCPGSTQGELPGRVVALINVKYTGTIRSGSPPACISNSIVTWDRAGSEDPGYEALFRNAGPQTLAPILDRFVLTWLAAVARPNPSPVSVFCPPFPRLAGTTSRCPR
jgi:hypothetical protein